MASRTDDDTIDKYEEKAAQFGTIVHIVSVETREGVQLRDIGKIAGILRYEVKVE